MADKSYISHLRDFIALTGSSNALKEHDNISPDGSLYYFPMKLDKTVSKTLLIILQLRKK